MKKISMFLALIACAFAQAVLANSAVVTSLTGTATAQSGTTAPRALRLGDEVSQGMTVATGPASNVVLRFADGQVAALSSSSQMQITTYQYEQQTGAGSILLSLINGGMRAVTGLIGRATPQKVAYRAATATIGIRGTDVTIVTQDGNVAVTVSEGSITFTIGGKTIIVPAGQGVNAKKDGTFQQSAAQQVLSGLSKQEADAIGGLAALTGAIEKSAAAGSRPTEGNPPGPPSQVPGVGNGGTPGGGGGGGGGPSKV